MTRVLVTGASGFIGQHLTHALLAQGIQVVGTVSHLRSGLASGVQWHALDLTDPAALRDLFHSYSFDGVYHLAAQGVHAQQDGSSRVLDVNVTASFLLGRLALQHKVPRFLHVGTGLEYQPQPRPIQETDPLRPESLYGASKVAAWNILDYLQRMEGLPLITVRPFSCYGPGEGSGKFIPFVISHALRQVPMALSSGTQVRDYLHVSDLIEAVQLLVARDGSVGEVYNVGAGPQAAQPLRETVRMILDYTRAPEHLAQFGTLHRNRKDAPHFVADPSKVQTHTGWEPCISLQQGLQDTIRWYESLHKEQA